MIMTSYRSSTITDAGKIEKKEGNYDQNKRIIRALYSEWTDNVIYDEAGRVYFTCRKTSQPNLLTQSPVKFDHWFITVMKKYVDL